MAYDDPNEILEGLGTLDMGNSKGKTFVSPVDGKEYYATDIAPNRDGVPTKYEGAVFITDAKTGEVVKRLLHNHPGQTGPGLSNAERYLSEQMGVDLTRKANGELTDIEKKRRGIPTNFTSDDVGKYTRLSVDWEDRPRAGQTIDTGGQFVIVDEIKDGKLLAQSIYGPNGRFIRGVNPRVSPGTNPYTRDAVEELIEYQAQMFGTTEQRIAALQSELKEKVYFHESVSSGSNPAYVNAGIRNVAKDLINAKTGVSDAVIDSISDLSFATGTRNSLHDWRRIVTSNNPMGALAASNASILQSVGTDKPYSESQFYQYASPDSIKTSTGYSIVYEADADVGEAVTGHLRLITPAGEAVTNFGGDRFGLALLNLRFGIGDINPQEFATFISDKSFRKYNNEDFINNLTNSVNYYSSEDFSYGFEIDYSSSFMIDPGWAERGVLHSQWQQSLSDQQDAQDSDTGTVTQPTVMQPTTAPTDSQTTTQETVTPTYETTTPGVTQTPTTETGAPAAVTPTTPTPGTTYPQQPVTGTFPSPVQTGGLGAVPGEVPAMTSGVAGFDMPSLTATMPGSGATTGVQTVTYSNQFGQSIPVTESNGQPVTYVPPGYSKTTGAAKGGMMRNGYADGGLVEAEKSMAAKFLGFKGGDLEKFLEANPAAAAKMGKYRTALRNKMTQKGTVFAQEGTFVDAAGQLSSVSGLGDQYQEQLAEMQRGAIQQTMQPMQAPVQTITPTTADFIPTTAGQATGVSPMAQVATIGQVEQAQMPVIAPTATMQPTAIAPQVQAATAATQAAQGQVSPQAQVTAAQQQQTSVSGLEAAQGTAIMMDNPVQRQIQEGELISGVANAEAASQYAEQIQAATATPTKQATVQGQLEGLMQQFEGGETPAWAAGSMRTAMQTLAARGLGASSLAGQAVIQAAMEAALPIAQVDAQTIAQFEAQNLSNRQQRAMLAAQQRAAFLEQEFSQAYQARVQNSSRIGDIANMNFTAEQQIALENSRAANTMNLNNLNNRQAMVMAEAAALANLDMSNLNNRQQAAVQNAQNFLQMDMANLSNEQQTAMFKAQQSIQAMFNDQAAENAAAQFNAQSENQTNQFFANLSSQTSQFNAAQRNAMDQFNVNSTNALREFNAELQQQRDLFNAQNGLVVAQANAQWRQNIATLNTAALNESNANFARTINGLTELNMNQIWQRERDIMSFAFQTANNNADRATSIAVENLRTEATKEAAEGEKSAGFAKAAGSIIGAIITG